MASRPLRGGDVMIAASFGRYLPISGHDHENGQVGYVAWILRRRAGLPGDLDNTPLGVRVALRPSGR
jgi:hypothetical protein